MWRLPPSPGPQPQALTADPEPEMQPLTPEELADPVKPYIQIDQDGTVVLIRIRSRWARGSTPGLRHRRGRTRRGFRLRPGGQRGKRIQAGRGCVRQPGRGQVHPAHRRIQLDQGFWDRYRRPPPRRGRGWSRPPPRPGRCRRKRSGSPRRVLHPSGKRAGFGELAVRAGKMPVPDGVRPKDPGQYKLIGRKGRLRIDTPAKILGTTQFTIDVAPPQMLTAVVLHPPKFGARPPQSMAARRWPRPASPRWSRSRRASR